jgi:hypothetical protein
VTAAPPTGLAVGGEGGLWVCEPVRNREAEPGVTAREQADARGRGRAQLCRELGREALATVCRLLDYLARVPNELRDQLPVVEDVDRDRPPVLDSERE